tara:strand:+ start:3046 stop:4137 length:1092 start_codon:yes stop_codon:yes gene_type:complete
MIYISLIKKLLIIRMDEKIKLMIINNYSKYILKPLDNDNEMNSCWINSSLYLLSSHPYIIFQYLLLDESRINNGYTKDIYSDIYINNIVYNYKYIKSENNEKSTLLYNQRLHKNLFDKTKLYNFIDENIVWGNIYDAQLTLNLLYDIITKSHTFLNNNLYLTVETRHLSNKTDIDKILYNQDTVIKGDRKLLGFIAGNVCHKYNIHAYGKNNLDTVHWVSYIRTSLSDDNKWYKFDSLYPKGKIINKSEIYDCTIKNYNKNLMCVYIDIDKFIKILSNTTIKKKYDEFVKLIEPTSNINDNKLEDIKPFINNFKETHGKNKNVSLDINLLSIQDLEYIYKSKIKDDYYNTYIVDKRAYFMNLN